MIELKFCPFCGFDSVEVYPTKCMGKICMCGACFRNGGQRLTKNSAIRAWNKKVEVWRKDMEEEE